MNTTKLIHDPVLTLTPTPPDLAEAGKGAAGKTGETSGEAVTETAKKIWGWLHPQAEKQPVWPAAMHKLAAQPENPDRQAVLRVRLEKLLQAHPSSCRDSGASWAAEFLETKTPWPAGRGLLPTPAGSWAARLASR